ncbi:hypothetical protein N431DRAFT_470352 [Stipitochalara longipes BDJ]|nr:hypothetical protein N431DRAFT_470352 [Stipitochalara longipes BDJ]
MGTTHHCPKEGKGKGNCRKPLNTPSRKKSYCPEHQTYCPIKECMELVHLKTEPCAKCASKQATEEKTRKEEEKKRKAKEEADKKAAAMAQSERDRNNKNKRKLACVLTYSLGT